MQQITGLRVEHKWGHREQHKIVKDNIVSVNILCNNVARQHLRVCVPFVNRAFEFEIHGTVNVTNFCFVLLVTWAIVCVSCAIFAKTLSLEMS